jgi:hypothetical protein
MSPRFLLVLAAFAGTVVAAPHAQARDAAPATDYRIAARVLPEQRRVEVTGTIRLAPADSARAEIPMTLGAPMSALRVELVEPATAATLEREHAADDTTRVAGERNVARWVLRPASPIAKGQPVVLRFSCEGDGGPGLLYHVSPEVAFASGWGDYWYPVPAGAGQGTGELTVTVPAGWKVATGAVRRSSDDEEARGVFRADFVHPTYFTFAAGPYTVVRRAGGAVPLSAWLLKPRERAPIYLAEVDTLFRAIIDEFGPYPLDELGLVEVPREIARAAGFNGFSPPGLLVLNHRAFDVPHVRHLYEWMGHEMGHQWFPHAFSLKTPPGLFAEEALAEYGGLRAVETIAGPEAARRMRTQGYEFDPIYSAAAYFTLVHAGVDHPVARLESDPHHRNLAYNKGSLVFDMLSREIGRAEFRRILHGLTRDRRFESLTWPEFLAEIERGAGRELDWFYEQWFERTGAPDFRLAWRQEGDTVRGAITQAAPHYRATLRIAIRGHAGQALDHVVPITGAATEFSVPVAFPTEKVELDPGYEVLRWTPEYRAAAAVKAPASAGKP